MSSYRLIHYIPSPERGARFPIAAALLEADGARLVEADKIPSAECLGGGRHSAALAMARQSLRRLASFEHLPISVGPHVVLDTIRELPAGVTDPVSWIKTHILSVGNGLTAVASKGRRRRGTHGMRFFQRYQVAGYVHKRFNPDIEGSRWLENTGVLKPVTHWVSGRNAIFLMEPVVPSFDSLTHDVEEIGQKFIAYRTSIVQRQAPDVKLLAYVLRGGHEDERLDAIAKLRHTTARVDVIDASLEYEAKRFTDDIRALALTVRPQGEFDSN